MPGDERRIEAEWVVDAEIRDLRPDARLVDDAVAEVPAGERNVRLERPLDELFVGRPPAEPREDPDVAALDEPEPAGTARDLRQLPGQERPSLLSVELRRLGEEKRLAREVDAMAEHVRRDAHVRGTREEAIDLLAARGERHRAVEDRDPAGMQAVHFAGEGEHRAAAERDHDGSRRERAERARADELERQLALEELQLVLGKRPLDERQRVERAEQQDLSIVAGEQQPRPRRAALRVVRPLHLVEDEEIAGMRRHLHGGADDRCALVHALLARDEADALLADPLAQPAVRFLRQHAQRACVDAGALLRELLQRGVGLTRVRRPEVGDDALRLDPARRQRRP